MGLFLFLLLNHDSGMIWRTDLSYDDIENRSNICYWNTVGPMHKSIFNVGINDIAILFNTCNVLLFLKQLKYRMDEGRSHNNGKSFFSAK